LLLKNIFFWFFLLKKYAYSEPEAEDAKAQGPLFYSKNTQAVIKLKSVELSAKSGILLSAASGQ